MLAAVGAGLGCLGIFISSIISLFILLFSGIWPDIDRKIISRGRKGLKCQTKIATDDILIFYFYLSMKLRLDFLCESSAKETRLDFLCESSADSLETSSLIFYEKQ